jgi:transmembrane sensor
VTEGNVTVDPKPAEIKAAPVSMGAGHRLLVRGDASSDQLPRVESLATAEIERRLAWRAARLELSNTLLSDAVAVLNRENRTQLEVREPALAELRLSGVFRADNAEGFVRLLEKHYGVQAEPRGDTTLVLRRAR